MKKYLFLLFFIIATTSLNAQNCEIRLKDSPSVSGYLVGLENGSVYYTQEGNDQKQEIKIKDIEEIAFDGVVYVFDENGQYRVRAGFLPKSKYEVVTAKAGEYTLHGKPYKGPVIITYLDRYLAGKDYSDIKGILVKVK